jgi:hypothetical protein
VSARTIPLEVIKEKFLADPKVKSEYDAQHFGGRTELEQRGFEGFASVLSLRSSNCGGVPELPGVYFVLRLDMKRPVFLDRSAGGHFKGEDPTVSVSKLIGKWVENALVLNIGKAGGPDNRATLRSRIRDYIRFGYGEAVGHRGGRYVWQLSDWQNLVVCWKPTLGENPREIEKNLIRAFEAVYDRLPFANLRH